jgi:hypothetical protein
MASTGVHVQGAHLGMMLVPEHEPAHGAAGHFSVHDADEEALIASRIRQVVTVPAASRTETQRLHTSPLLPPHTAALTLAPASQLDSEDPQTVASAAEVLFSRSHISHPTCVENKDRMRLWGAIPPLCRGLRSESWPVKYHACSALSELAFCNKRNCMAIVTTPGALDALVDILLSNVLNMHEDAALVVNNCAAFSEEVCMAIVECPGMVSALKRQATSGSFGARCVAVGALNCLSRCKEAKPSLYSMRVVEDALVPVLSEAGSGDKHEARKVRAAMAVANLTGRCPRDHARDYDALEAMVKVLGYALDGRSWAGIHLSSYSVLYPLSHLAEHREHRQSLIDFGLIHLLACSIDRWVSGVRADADELTLPLVLKIVEHLAQEWQYHNALRQAGIVRGLREVAKGAGGEAPESLSSARVLLEHLLQAPLAVCMGQHTRLGSNSTFFRVDEYVMALIIDMSFEVTPSASSETGRFCGSECAFEDLGSDNAAMTHANN